MAPRGSDAAGTRMTIITSAAREFSRAGFAATPISTLLEGSGMTKGAFYFHFRAKDDIAVAIVDAMHAQWAPALQRWATSDLDALEIVLALLDELVVRVTADDVVRAGLRLTVDHELDQAEMLPPWPEWERIFTTLFHRAERTGLLGPRVNPATAAHLFVYGLVGELFAIGYTDETELLRERVDQMTLMLMPAFATPQWSARWADSDWSFRELPRLDTKRPLAQRP